MQKTRFTKSEFELFFFELNSKFWAGVRGETTLIYTFFTLLGVGIASWQIPKQNGSEISPETLGIYVIGVLISVGLDALDVLIKNKPDTDNSQERAIAKTFLCITALLAVWSCFLSTISNAATVNVCGRPEVEKHWRWGSEFFLGLILLVGILMSLTIAGMDSSQPAIGSLNRDPAAIENKK